MTFRLAVILLAWLCTACSSPPEDIHETRFMMGTLVKFTISDVPRAKAMEAIRAATGAMQRVSDEFTIYGDVHNAVKRFNASPPDTPVQLPKEIAALLKESLRISRQSHGSFTPVIGTLSLLWGFSLPDPPHKPPAPAAIRKALAGVHDADIRRTPRGWARLNPETRLDFGGIAKGYAIDRGVEALQQHGIANAILDAGGDLRVLGSHHGKPWRIGIRHPRDPEKVLGWLAIKGDKSIVTSGDYERFFIYHGRRYHHILNPGTGRPARLSMSTTVIAPDATRADAWSTALFVMGAQGLPLIRRHGMQAILMDADGHLHLQLTGTRFHSDLPKADTASRRFVQQKHSI